MLCLANFLVFVWSSEWGLCLKPVLFRFALQPAGGWGWGWGRGYSRSWGWEVGGAHQQRSIGVEVGEWHTVFGLCPLVPEDRAALLGQRKVKILKAFQLFSFYWRAFFFFCCAELLTQNVEPIPKVKGELKVGRKSWFVQFLLFLQVTRKGFLYFYMRHYQSQAKMPRELAQKWQLSYLKGEIIFSQSVFSPIFVAHTQFWWLIFVVLKIQLSCVVSLASSI